MVRATGVTIDPCEHHSHARATRVRTRTSSAVYFHSECVRRFRSSSSSGPSVDGACESTQEGTVAESSSERTGRGQGRRPDITSQQCARYPTRWIDGLLTGANTAASASRPHIATLPATRAPSHAAGRHVTAVHADSSGRLKGVTRRAVARHASRHCATPPAAQPASRMLIVIRSGNIQY